MLLFKNQTSKVVLQSRLGEMGYGTTDNNMVYWGHYRILGALPIVLQSSINRYWPPSVIRYLMTLKSRWFRQLFPQASSPTALYSYESWRDMTC